MQQGPEPIVIVTTGGTIDKAYFDALSLYQIGEPVVKKLLDGANVTHPHRIVELLRKDSLELTDEDRQHLKETVAAIDERHICRCGAHPRILRAIDRALNGSGAGG